jgi:uncharacterized protein involved in outer membrane biogenesis
MPKQSHSSQISVLSIIRSLIKVLILFAVLAAMLEFMDLSFTLEGARHTLSKKLTSYTGREIHVDGDIQLSLSYSPQLLVKRIHIKNTSDFDDEDFITIGEVQIEVLLLPLLHGQLHLSDISADQAKIDLHQKADGRNNWSLTNITEQPGITDNRSSDSNTESINIERISLGKIELTNITIQYRDDTRQQKLKNSLDQLLIDISDDTKPSAEINGRIEGHRYAITFESESPELLVNGKSWSIHGAGHIANRQTGIEASIRYIDNIFISDIDFDVTSVDLGRLLDDLEIVSDQAAITDNISIKARLHGRDFAELYEQAEISLRLGKGYWDLGPAETDQGKRLIFRSASSFISWQKPVELSIDGKIEDEPIKLKLKSNRLSEFFDDIQKLDIDLVAGVSGTDITLKGMLDLPIKTKQLQLDISIRSKDLEKLNPIINTEFPPLNNFNLAGNLISNKKGYILKSASASIGESQFQTSIVIDTTSAKPLWHINLNSKQLQLQDFSFDDWSMKQPAAVTGKDAEHHGKNKPYLEPMRHLEDLVRSTDMHLDLNLKVDQVLSGKDHLGKARFQLHLRDHSLNIKNLVIEIPGGSITSSLSLSIIDNEASGHMSLDIDKLDYGISTRLFQPESQVDGIISTRVNLDLGGSDFTHLFDQATGNIDIAIWPKNTRPAKALNLWTTNLYLILLPELKKKESLVNCMVGLLNLEDGKMREELLALDTTKLWIYGNINVDFKQEHVKLSLFPQSKTARLFSFQSPIRIEGSFSDIGMEINPVDLTGSYISFITSPLHVPARRLFGDRVPENGSAICEQLFDREYVEKLNAELRLKEKIEIDEMLESD